MGDVLKDLRAELEAQGFEIRETKKGFMIIPPDPAAQVVVVHKTESDHRAASNTLARLRRSGFIQRRK